MGCNTSAPAAAPAHPTPPKGPSSITILIAGQDHTGKSAFARRFADKTFQESAAPFQHGSRSISVNGERVQVKVANVAYASKADIASADGILYTVRGDSDAPFKNVYKYIDALYNLDAEVAASTVVGLKFASDKSHAGRSAYSNASVSICSSNVSPSEVSALTGAGASNERTGEGGGVAPVAPVPFSGKGSLAFANLRLETGSASLAPSRTPSLLARTLEVEETEVQHEVPPMAVVVTMCDVLDDRAEEDPRALVRLRAMASNWSSANRCRVTFVSARSGVGVNSALAHLIKQIYVRSATQASIKA